MLNGLIRTSLHLRLLVVALAFAIVVLGLVSLRRSKMDVFPEFAPPRVEVQIEAPGLSTEEVERLVSIPVENALSSTPFVSTLRSKSVLGLSSVLLILESGANLEVARQNVQERLALATASLPAAARTPVILPPLSSTSRILKIGIGSKSMSQMDMSEAARWTIRPRLMAIPGVANVAIWGQRDRQLQVVVGPRQLASRGVSLEEVIVGVGNAVSVGGGGFIDTPNQRLAVRHESWVRTPSDLGRAVVASRNGTTLRVSDVGKVRIGYPPPIGDAVINGKPGLLLIVEKYPWGNTLEVTRGVEKALEELHPALPQLDIDTTIFRPATFIETALANLSSALWIGCLLVVLVLLLFLADLPSAIISALAIPVSLLSAILVIIHLGHSVNTMVIAGLAIALGAVVDDAIIDVENITRRLRLNGALGQPEPVAQVILKASLEVRSSIVYATAIVIVAICPVFFLEGVAGAFFAPLASAYVLAILVSLIVALTLTPALCLMLLRVKPGEHSVSPVSRWLQSVYSRVLLRTLHRPKLISVIVMLGLSLTIFAFPRFGQEFLPHFKETDFLMHWVGKPGASLQAMRRITARASDELTSIPGVRNFGSHIGRALAADEVVGPNFTELWISIRPDVDYDATVRRIQEVVSGYPGLHRDVLTYLRERIKEVLSGTSASIVVRISGPELAGLRQSAQQVARALGEVPGVTELKVEAQVLVPQISIKMRPEKAAIHGLSERDLRRAEAVFINGLKVGEVYSGQAIHDVVVWSETPVRDDLSALRELLVEAPGGNRVPLKEVADIAIVPAPNAIRREGASRCIDVSCNVEGRDLGSVAGDIRAKLKTLPFAPGYYPQTLGEFEAQDAARGRLMGLAGVALLAILVLLQSDFQSPRLVAVIFLSLPFSLIGGAIGIAAGGGVISLGSVVGFVAVLGIAARNGIMLVSHYRHLQQEEGCAFDQDLVLRGASERLVPILMTALTATLALVPIVVGGNLPGYEIEYPMALVILGGMTSSTVLSLFLLPVFYFHWGNPGSSSPVSPGPTGSGNLATSSCASSSDPTASM